MAEELLPRLQELGSRMSIYFHRQLHEHPVNLGYVRSRVSISMRISQ